MLDRENLAYASVGLCPGCEQCQSDYGLDEEEFAKLYESGELFDEGGFSFHDCELCGTDISGDRYAAHYRDGDEIVHIDICVDCVAEIGG